MRSAEAFLETTSTIGSDTSEDPELQSLELPILIAAHNGIGRHRGLNVTMALVKVNSLSLR